jgi:hypothetical protein
LKAVLCNGFTGRAGLTIGEIDPPAPAADEVLIDVAAASVTCLAPDIVEVILDGRQHKGFRLVMLLRGIPLAWEEQRRVWGTGGGG